MSDPVSGGLPRTVSEPQDGPYLDVSCDGRVSPLDALLVINHINHNDPFLGESPTGGGTYTAAACSPQLQEGTGFATQMSRALTLPDENSAVQVVFHAPEFDHSSRRTIRDAFEIEVTDVEGNALSLPYGASYDAVYNWSEDLEPVFGPSVATTTAAPGEDSTATINLSGLPAGTRVQVTTRLVNNDLDDGTSVIIRGFEVVEASGTVASGLASAASRVRGIEPVEFDELSDVSQSFVANYARTTLVGENNELVTQLMVTNRGNQTSTASVSV